MSLLLLLDSVESEDSELLSDLLDSLLSSAALSTAAAGRLIQAYAQVVTTKYSVLLGATVSGTGGTGSGVAAGASATGGSGWSTAKGPYLGVCAGTAHQRAEQGHSPQPCPRPSVRAADSAGQPLRIQAGHSPLTRLTYLACLHSAGNQSAERWRLKAQTIGVKQRASSTDHRLGWAQRRRSRRPGARRAAWQAQP